MRHILALAAVLPVLLAAGAAQACLFARDAQPKDWLEWASALLAADVTGIERKEARAAVKWRWSRRSRARRPLRPRRCRCRRGFGLPAGSSVPPSGRTCW